MNTDKQSVMTEITRRLTALNVPFTCGGGADIVIAATFLDAKWGSGQKKITFEASVLLDETRKVALLWQKTAEREAGFSFGFTSENSFQRGKALYRKVKSVQYAPGGKAYEYELDLGAITRAIEETAKNGGWQFTIVMSRGDASYPPDGLEADHLPVTHAAFCNGCGAPLLGNFCGRCGRKAV
jgi:hypothetical protein